MSENIFSEQTPVPVVDTPALVLPQEVTEFVGSGKKYGSVEDALKSVPHAQKHIQTLESELAQVKEELTKRRTTEELLDEIKSGIPPVEKPLPQGYNQDDIAATVEAIIAKKEAVRSAENNINNVTNSFKEVFGDKAEEKYNLIAEESGLTVQQLNKLSASSPQAVFKLAGISSKKDTTVSKTSSSVITDGFSQGNPPELSAKVKQGASTKDLVNAWRNAGEKVKLNSK